MTELETSIRRQVRLSAGASVGKSARHPGADQPCRARRKKRSTHHDQCHHRPNPFVGDRHARNSRARHHFAPIAHLVGDGTQGGILVSAINRNERRYYGPCTTITGRDQHGQPVECAQDLWEDRETPEITCPRCDVTIDARKQLENTRIQSDLRTMDLLLETMRNLGETVGRNRVQG